MMPAVPHDRIRAIVEELEKADRLGAMNGVASWVESLA